MASDFEGMIVDDEGDYNYGVNGALADLVDNDSSARRCS